MRFRSVRSPDCFFPEEGRFNDKSDDVTIACCQDTTRVCYGGQETGNSGNLSFGKSLFCPFRIVADRVSFEGNYQVPEANAEEHRNNNLKTVMRICATEEIGFRRTTTYQANSTHE